MDKKQFLRNFKFYEQLRDFSAKSHITIYTYELRTMKTNIETYVSYLPEGMQYISIKNNSLLYADTADQLRPNVFDVHQFSVLLSEKKFYNAFRIFLQQVTLNQIKTIHSLMMCWLKYGSGNRVLTFNKDIYISNNGIQSSLNADSIYYTHFESNTYIMEAIKNLYKTYELELIMSVKDEEQISIVTPHLKKILNQEMPHGIQL